jgi:hypothetical protein
MNFDSSFKKMLENYPDIIYPPRRVICKKRIGKLLNLELNVLRRPFLFFWLSTFCTRKIAFHKIL